MKLVAKALAWHGILRTALPAVRPRRRDALAAYLPSVGLNAMLPGRVGMVARVALVKARAPAAPTATVAATMAAESLTNLVPLGLLLVAALPLMPALGPLAAVQAPSIPAASPAAGLALAVGAIALAALARRLGGAPARVACRALVQMRAGFAIFTGRPVALMRVLGWELTAWTARLASLVCFLAAYGIRPAPAVLAAVLVAQAAASLAVVMPLGAGAQQVALVAALAGMASPGDVLAFGVGMQLAVAAAGVTAGVAALVVAGGAGETRAVVGGSTRSLARALGRVGQRKDAESIVARKNSSSGQPSSPSSVQPALNTEGMV
jgi:phosphatidylinositol alpha-mannosyltransferase